MAKYGYSALSRLFAVVSQFVLIAVIGRGFGLETTGVYAAMFSLAATASVFMGFGQPAYCLRELPQARNMGNTALFDQTSARAMRVSVAGCLLFSVPVLIFASIYWSSYSTALLAVGMSILLNLAQVTATIMRCFGSVFKSEFTLNTLWRGLAILAIAGYVWAQEGGYFWQQSIPWHRVEKSTIASQLVLYAMMLGVLITFIWVKRSIGVFDYILSSNFHKVDRKADRDSWFVQSVQAIIANVDVLLVASILGATEAGKYFILVRLASLLALPLSVTNPVIGPVIGRIAKLTDTVDLRLQRRVFLNSGLNFGSTIVLSLILILTIDLAYSLMTGVHLSEADRCAFFVLIGIQATNALVGPSIIAAQIFNVRSDIYPVMLFLLAIQILSIYYFGTMFGVLGAAVGVAVGRIPLHFWILYKLKKTAGFNLITGHKSSVK